MPSPPSAPLPTLGAISPHAALTWQGLRAGMWQPCRMSICQTQRMSGLIDVYAGTPLEPPDQRVFHHACFRGVSPQWGLWWTTWRSEGNNREGRSECSSRCVYKTSAPLLGDFKSQGPENCLTSSPPSPSSFIDVTFTAIGNHEELHGSGVVLLPKTNRSLHTRTHHDLEAAKSTYHVNDLPLRTAATSWFLQNKLRNPISVLKELNLHQWLMFTVGFLGWTWDSFDFFTVSLTVSEIATDFQVNVASVSWVSEITSAPPTKSGPILPSISAGHNGDVDAEIGRRVDLWVLRRSLWA